MPVVGPCCRRRQRGQDRFHPSTRLKAIERPALLEQVELDVTPPAIELEIPFPGSKRVFVPALDDRQVSGQEMVPDLSCELERTLESPVGQIVEKDSTHAARFVSMFQVKVVVTPGLETRIYV